MPTLPATTAPTSPSATGARRAVDGVVVAVGSLALGGLTSWAQGFLPDALASLANSASGWTLCTVLLVAAVRPRLVPGAVWGVVGFVGLVLGYTLASEVRGLHYDPTYWGAIGVLAGPVVGAAAAELRTATDRWRTALAGGALAGILVAEGTYGLTEVADTTSPVWWTTCLVLAVGLVVVVAARLRAPGPVAALLVTAAAAGASLLAVMVLVLG